MLVCVCVEEPGQETRSRVDGRYFIQLWYERGRGMGSRDGECVSELESEYERVRARELI